jgi:hypothetical protein
MRLPLVAAVRQNAGFEHRVQPREVIIGPPRRSGLSALRVVCPALWRDAATLVAAVRQNAGFEHRVQPREVIFGPPRRSGLSALRVVCPALWRDAATSRSRSSPERGLRASCAAQNRNNWDPTPLRSIRPTSRLSRVLARCGYVRKLRVEIRPRADGYSRAAKSGKIRETLDLSSH